MHWSFKYAIRHHGVRVVVYWGNVIKRSIITKYWFRLCKGSYRSNIRLCSWMREYITNILQKINLCGGGTTLYSSCYSDASYVRLLIGIREHSGCKWSTSEQNIQNLYKIFRPDQNRLYSTDGNFTNALRKKQHAFNIGHKIIMGCSFLFHLFKDI